MEDRPVTKEELDRAIDSLRIEMKNEFSNLDLIKLNGSLEALKTFGRFLQSHPDFLLRAKEREDDLQEWQVVKDFLKRKLSFMNNPINWLRAGIGLLAMGVAYALGARIMGAPSITAILHKLGVP